MVLEKDGLIGLFGRGLKTKILANGMQGTAPSSCCFVYPRTSCWTEVGSAISALGPRVKARVMLSCNATAGQFLVNLFSCAVPSYCQASCRRARQCGVRRVATLPAALDGPPYTSDLLTGWCTGMLFTVLWRLGTVSETLLPPSRTYRLHLTRSFEPFWPVHLCVLEPRVSPQRVACVANG